MERFPSREILVKTIIDVMQNNPELTSQEMNKLVSRELKLSESLLAIENANCSGTEFSYRMCWARTLLKQRGVICNPSRGIWRLSSICTMN